MIYQLNDEANPIAYSARYCYITGPLLGKVTGWKIKHLGAEGPRGTLLLNEYAS